MRKWRQAGSISVFDALDVGTRWSPLSFGIIRISPEAEKKEQTRMSMAFEIMKKAMAIKLQESGPPISDGEAMFRAIRDYNPYLAAKVVDTCDPRLNIDACILFLVGYFRS